MTPEQELKLREVLERQDAEIRAQIERLKNTGTPKPEAEPEILPGMTEEEINYIKLKQKYAPAVKQRKEAISNIQSKINSINDEISTAKSRVNELKKMGGFHAFKERSSLNYKINSLIEDKKQVEQELSRVLVTDNEVEKITTNLNV